MRLGQNLLQQGAAGGGGGGLPVEDVFSTDLYTGNSSTQTITNGIDLSGEGGLVWAKDRTAANAHVVVDTARGKDAFLSTRFTIAENTSFTDTIASFNSDGFSLGAGTWGGSNNSGNNFVAWTFRKAPRFFDVVTYTGNGVAGRTIPHNLGVEPGMIVVKRRDSSASWFIYHVSRPGEFLILNNADAASSAGAETIWGDDVSHVSPTLTEFTIGSAPNVNGSGGTYVAYLFAHDTAAGGVIQCGSYTGNGSTTGPTISLGWEPQWLLLRRTSGGDWIIHDSARDTSNPRTAFLEPNTSDAEANGNDVDFTSSGFQLKSTSATVNAFGGTYAYVAIRAEGA